MSMVYGCEEFENITHLSISSTTIKTLTLPEGLENE